MRGVLYISRTSSLVQSYLGVFALTACLRAPWASGAGGGVVEIGEKESLTGVENERVHAADEACSERAVARLDKRVSDMLVGKSE